jgi:hypothetical protein
MPNRKTVFVSYSHKNKRWLQRLRVHLTPYERNGVVEIWDDSKIAPGDRWHSEIQNAIERAAASIVLISPDFLASDFVVEHELPKLLRKAERGGARILPIIVEPCELTIHPELAAFQALNSPREPLATMSRAEADYIWVRAVSAIGKLFPARAGTEGNKRTPPRATSVDGQVFETLHAASISIAVLWALQANGAELTISELEKTLTIRSRKRVYQAVEGLVTEGWMEKVKRDGLTKYRSTNEGARQMQRIAAASDGPVRRAFRTR